MAFENQFGLTNPHSRDIVSENCMPTTVQHHNILIALHGASNVEAMQLRKNMISYIHECRTNKDGLYNQYPKWYMELDTFKNPKDKWVSKDQLMAMICMLGINENYYLVYEINKYLRSHFNCYNNLQKFWSWPAWMGLQARYLAEHVTYPHDHDAYEKLIDICNDQIYRDTKDPERSTGALKAFTILSSLIIMNNGYKKLRPLIMELKGELEEFYTEGDHPIRLLLKEF